MNSTRPTAPLRCAQATLCLLLAASIAAQSAGSAGGQDPPPSPGQPAPAQDPQRPPEPKPQEPRPQPQEPTAEEPKPALNEADKAAEMLRRLLGLKPGGVEPPPPTRPVQSQPQPQGAPPAGESQQVPRAGEGPGTGAPQDPQEPRPSQPVDPAERAAEGLQRLLPGALRPTDPGPPPPPEARPPQPAQAEDPSVAPALPAAGAAASPSAPPAPGRLVRGSLQTWYRFRRTGDDRDHELVAVLRLDVGDEERDAVTGHFSGRGFVDLDGLHRDDVFNGRDDVFGDPINGYVYEAYADLHRVEGLEVVRLGRQGLYDTPVLLEFDGARVETERAGVSAFWAGAYVGSPVHHFEASRSGDLVVGATAGFRPWDRGRLRLDAVHLEDRTLTFSGSDDLLGVSWWQTVGEAVELHGKHTWLDGDPHELLLSGRGQADSLGLDATITWRELLHRQRAGVTELDPYFTVLGTYAPYRQLEVVLGKAFGERWNVAAGADVRRLRDAADEGLFNREFERLWIGPSVERVLGEELTLSVQGEYWNSSGEAFRSVSGDARWRISPRWIGTLGSSFALYRYDTFDGLERDNVRDYYLRMQYRPTEAWRFDGALAFEDSDLDRFFTLRLGATWSF